MKMWLDLLLLVIGFVLLLKGADVFVDGSAGVARIFKVPGVIIGLTIVAMGTSAPELAVSVSAGISGSNAIAVSNVVGSNIFNLLMVLGICAMMKALPVDSGIKKRDYPISLVATLILLNLAGNLFFVGKVPDYRNMNASGGVLYRWNGIILIALFVLYLAYTIYLAKKNKETENDEAKKMQEEAQAEKEKYDALVAALAESGKTVDELLDALRAAVPEGWHACTAQGTNGAPMWGDLIGSDAGGVRLHSFRYHGVPDTYRIILVTKSGESWVSDTLHRATLQSSATVDWAKRTASAPSAAHIAASTAFRASFLVFMA